MSAKSKGKAEKVRVVRGKVQRMKPDPAQGPTSFASITPRELAFLIRACGSVQVSGDDVDTCSSVKRKLLAWGETVGVVRRTDVDTSRPVRAPAPAPTEGKPESAAKSA